MEQSDLELLKDIPGFKAILRAVIRSQMKHLIDQLHKHGDEETMVLTTSISEGSFYHAGSASAEGFLNKREEIKSQFLGHCLKNFLNQPKAEQTQEIEDRIVRNIDDTQHTVETFAPMSSSRSGSSTGQNSESGPNPVSLTTIGNIDQNTLWSCEKRSFETISLQNVPPAAGSGTDYEPKRVRVGKKRVSVCETVTSDQPVKRKARAKTNTLASKTVTASVETSEETIVNNAIVKVENENEDLPSPHDEDKTIEESVLENKDSDMKLPVEIKQSNKTFDADDIVLTEVKVEPVEVDDDLADIDRTASQLNFSNDSTAAGMDQSNDPSNQTGKDLMMDCLAHGKIFSSKDGLKHHLKRPADKPHHCTTCTKSFFRKDVLSAHMRTHVDTGDDFVICDICGVCLKSKSSLYNHRNSVHEKKTFECVVCQKSFSSKQNKTRHEESHGPDKECSICKKTFKRLDDHTRLCKKTDRKGNFKCQLCEKVFLELKYLKEHQKYKHAPERYQCAKCAHLFSHRKTFLEHTKKCRK